MSSNWSRRKRNPLPVRRCTHHVLRPFLLSHRIHILPLLIQALTTITVVDELDSLPIFALLPPFFLAALFGILTLSRVTTDAQSDRSDTQLPAEDTALLMFVLTSQSLKGGRERVSYSLSGGEATAVSSP